MPTTPLQFELDGYVFEGMERGHGNPMLFVHGSVSDFRTWLPRLERFGGSSRALTYSRRFHWPNEPISDTDDYDMDQQVDDLIRAIETLELTPVDLVGHSYGGFLVLLVAVRRPDLVRSMALVEPPVVPLFVSDPPKPVEFLRLLVTRPRAAAAVLDFGGRGLEPARKAARAGDYERALRIFGKTALGKEAFEKLPSARFRQVQDNWIAAEFTGSGFSPITAREVAQVETPTLLLHGERSPALFPQLIRRLDELLPNSKVVEIPDSSHIVHEDNPGAFDAALMEFFGEVRQETEPAAPAGTASVRSRQSGS